MTIFFDIETPVDRRMTLKRMTLRQYLAAVAAKGGMLGLAIAEDDEDPVWFTNDELPLDYLRERLTDGTVWVAHNASFDVRCLVHLLKLPYPSRWQCTLEVSMCALPNHPGGYSLDNLAQTLRLNAGKKSGKGHNVMHMGKEELAEYCRQDVRLCRDIYRICEHRVHPYEWAISEVCSRVKEVELLVDHKAVKVAVDQFTAQADTYGVALLQALEDPGAGNIKLVESLGMEDDGHVRSVKPQHVKRLLLEHLGFTTHSISAKNLNPVALAQNQEAAKAVESATKTNRSLSFKRRVIGFAGIDVLDAELSFYAAHTGRFSSRSSGKGLNLHNMPKHDKEVAKLVRSMFRLPPGYVFVQGDEANVEYRVNGLLANSIHVRSLFTRDPLADPYAAFGMLCTGKLVTKADPARQLWKAAVLGLGFLMGDERWARELLKEMAKPKPAFTMAALQTIVEENGWQFPRGRRYTGILNKLGCDPAVVCVAFHSRRLFHETHPEFRQLASWLMEAATLTSQGAGQSAIDDLYTVPNAPPRQWLDAQVRTDFEGYTLALRLAGWPAPTVYWRDLGVRDIPAYGPSLSFMNGKRGYRGLSPSIAIENAVQSAARNRTCQAKLDLTTRGWPYLLSVHDAIMPIVPANTADVLRLRDDMLAVLGPDTKHVDGFPAWAVMINPAEINVSQSFYEVDVGSLDPRFPTSAAWWQALSTHPELLENLS